jgi:nitrogen fixation/metabolism regulation signal transduction histidine kinase
MDSSIFVAPSRVLPMIWRTAAILVLAGFAVHLLATTNYYASTLVIVALMVIALFSLAHLLARGEAAGSSAEANRLIARLQAGERRMVQHHNHLESLLDTVSAALIVMESDGRIHLANRAARLLARQPVLRLGDIPAIGADAAARIKAIAPGTRTVLRLANGQQMLVSLSLFVSTGEQRLVSLQSVVGELDAVQLKAWEDMTRVLAHEIMNSLTPISSLSESLSGMLRDGCTGSDTLEAADTIARRSRGLSDFVERYRRIAQVPQPRLQTVRMSELLAELERLMRSKLDGIAYSSQIEPPDLQFEADPGLVQQALINLLQNAIDAAGADPAIAVSCTGLDHEIAISVADNGEGVPDNLQNDIFVPFFTTKPGGSGIGLSLARQIALAHGGRIEVAANPPHGAVFRISLPAS